MKKIIVLALIATLGCSASTFAQSWKKDHPRRAEVNNRLANQDRRIHKEVREGEMSKAEASRLHRQDRQVRNQERRMAARNGGHITKAQQRELNRKENRISRKIGK